jgi:hypothetical protein
VGRVRIGMERAASTTHTQVAAGGEGSESSPTGAKQSKREVRLVLKINLTRADQR